MSAWIANFRGLHNAFQVVGEGGNLHHFMARRRAVLRTSSGWFLSGLRSLNIGSVNKRARDLATQNVTKFLVPC
jgi:hypothetical protein